MLTPDQQQHILRKVDQIRRSFHQRIRRVEKGEISPQRSKVLSEQELDELQEILKEAG